MMFRFFWFTWEDKKSIVPRGTTIINLDFLEENKLKEAAENPYVVCKDYTVSGEKFQLHYNPKMELLETFPKPDLEELPSYYKSEKYISHTDSSSGFLDKIYQKVKSYMLDKKLSWIKSKKGENSRLLDIGAGTGDFLLRAKDKNWKVNGVEPNPKARSLAAKKGIELFENTAEFPSHSFDVITMWHVLEHVPNLNDQLEELERILKPDGLLVVAVPNFKSWDAEKYKEFWAAYDVPRHLWHFSRNSIKILFQKNGFEVKSTKALLFDSFYVSLLSEKYKNGHGNILGGIWNGFLSNLKAMGTKEYSSVVYFIEKAKKRD